MTQFDEWATAGSSQIRYADTRNLTSIYNYNSRYARNGHFHGEWHPDLTNLTLRGDYKYPRVDLTNQTILEYFQADVTETYEVIMPETASIDDFRWYSGDGKAENIDYCINKIWSYIIGGTSGNMQFTSQDEAPSSNSYDSWNYLTASGWTATANSAPANYHCTPLNHAASIHETDATTGWTAERSATVAISTDNTGSLKFGKDNDLSTHSIKVTSGAQTYSNGYISASIESGSVYQFDVDCKVDSFNASSPQQIHLPDTWLNLREIDVDTTTWEHFTFYETAINTGDYPVSFRANRHVSTAGQELFVDNLIVKKITEHVQQESCTGIGIENDRNSVGSWSGVNTTLSVDPHRKNGSNHSLKIDCC